MYYIINKDTRELIRESKTPFNADETIQPDPPLIQLKRVVDDTRPTFDAATEKLVGTSTDDDVNFTRTFHYVVQPMTAEEQQAYQRRLADAATLQQIKAVYQDLKNGTGTNLERIVRVEKALAWLLRDYMTNGGAGLKK